jgi:inhibitor of cysteine peptidase
MDVGTSRRKIIILVVLFVVLVLATNILISIKQSAIKNNASNSQPTEGQGDQSKTSREAIIADKTKSFSVLLDSNPTTGYSWDVKFDDTYLKLNKSDYRPLPSENKVGSGGTQSFEFSSLKTGETEITFSYRRPWETNVAPQQIKIFKVTIQ